MSEPPNPLWTLGAVVLGGFLTVFGQIIADRIEFRQEVRRITVTGSVSSYMHFRIT
jgi:hypothetical protein